MSGKACTHLLSIRALLGMQLQEPQPISIAARVLGVPQVEQ